MQSTVKQRGITLIEVLVTLVILTIGITGIAMVQARSMQSGAQMKYRSAAISSAQSIVDVMRANRIGIAAQSLASLQSYVGTNATMPASTTQEGQDFLAFNAELQASLPNRSPTFAIAVDGSRVVTVTIGWTQREDTGTGTTTESYIVKAIL